MADFRPAAIFGPHASIGRPQFVVSFLYEAVVIVLAGSCAASGGALGTLLAVLGAVAAYAMMTLAMRARIADAGMSTRWLALPFAFLAVDMLRAAAGESAAFDPAHTPLLSLSGVVFLVKTAMVALLLLLMLVPSRPAGLARPA